MIRVVLFILIQAFVYPLWAQDEEFIERTRRDTSSLLNAFRGGKSEGRFRMYYMSTNNDDPLTDYYSLAFGGGINFKTKSFKGFQVGVGGFFIWNLASSDLTKPDSITGIPNRYEIGQFDQTDPSNKKDLQRLEDFYIQYNFKKSFIRFGKQVLKTPFINPQDGRMRPTGEQGLWAEINEFKKLKAEFGWLTHISPRGTIKWYGGASSIGIYPSGVAVDGTKSNYKNNITSSGIAIAGLTYNFSKVKLQLWDHWIENISNTVLLQADAVIPINEKKKITGGFQYIHQEAVKNGGNADPSKTYFDPGETANIFSLSTGVIISNSSFKINYTRITSSGRFLFPREWGREPLYTFLPRERNEGTGDVNAFTINFNHQFKKQRIITDFSAGSYRLPDVLNYRLNKYGFPSYYQVNADIRYSFNKFLEGLQAQFLYVYKFRTGNTYNNLKYIINKVDMHQINMVLNYNF